MTSRRNISMILAAVLLIAVLVGSQAMGTSVAPAVAGDTAGRALGRAGFAYLGGLRTFAAAVLWNRIEPVFHSYYDGVPLAEQKYMVPTLYLVTVLDPQFVQAYYLSSFMVGEMVSPDTGIELAREGVANNPRSGLLHANLAQLLYVQDKQAHRDEILKHASAALADDAVWADDEERYEGYILVARMVETMGFQENADKIDAVLEKMRANGLGRGDHDHDGDGQQDH